MISAGAYEGKISAMLSSIAGESPVHGDRVFLIGTHSFNAVLTMTFCSLALYESRN
jgi:hypothetical protein